MIKSHDLHDEAVSVRCHMTRLAGRTHVIVNNPQIMASEKQNSVYNHDNLQKSSLFLLIFFAFVVSSLDLYFFT